jgi:hypothetical protein
MALYIWPGSDLATDTAQIEQNTRPIGFWTLPYDEIVPDYSGSVTNVYVSKLAGVTQQTLTVTYEDATKNVEINFKVV